MPRNLLLFIPLIGLCSCGTDYPPNSREITEWTISRGGSVLLVDGKEEIRDAALLPREPFAIDRINLAESPVTDADLSKLAEAEGVESLSLYGTKITDAGVDSVLKMSALRELELSNTNITDESLRKLAGLSTLKKLYVYDTLVTADGVAEFRQRHGRCRVYSNTAR